MNLDSVVLLESGKSQWLDQCRQLSSGKRTVISQVTVAVAPVIVCRCNVEGRKEATRSDEWTNLLAKTKETRILTHLKTFELQA
jgi:hypothetical protein